MGVRDSLLRGVVARRGRRRSGGRVRPAGSVRGREPLGGWPSSRPLGVPSRSSRGRRRDPPRLGREGAAPRPPAPELAVMRRLSLALTGTIPSLEEIRRFEARPAGGAARRLARRPAPRPPLRRLPGRAARPRLRRHRGRPVHPVPPPAVHRLAQRRDPRGPAVRRDRPRPDRRPGPLDRPSGDELRLRDVRPGTRAARPRAPRRAGVARLPRRRGSTAPSATTTRSSPGSRRDFRGLAAFFGGVRLRPPRHPRRRERLPADRPQDARSRATVAPRVPFLPELLPDAGTPRERLAALGRRPEEPEPRPRHGQPRLGPAVRPPPGRAGGRPAAAERGPRRPWISWPTTSRPTATTSIA